MSPLLLESGATEAMNFSMWSPPIPEEIFILNYLPNFMGIIKNSLQQFHVIQQAQEFPN